MSDLPNVPISDFENEIPGGFPGEEASIGPGGIPLHLPLGDASYPHGAPLTVPSTNSVEHSIAC